MRNLKRALSLALASVMLLGMMVVGSSAAFSDADEIVNKEAVEITAGLGLFAGSDGKFNPKGNVTRAQMATVIVKMLYGSQINADQFKGTNTFNDTVTFEGGWAEGYINLCASLGIVKGYGDGSFKPGNSVTTAEAVTMIINALKVDAGEGTWPLTVMAKAEEMELFAELAVKPGTNVALTRDDLASIVLEGLNYSPSNSNTYTVTAGGKTFEFDTLADALDAVGGIANIGMITENPAADTLAKTVFEMKTATGYILENQATGEDYTLVDGLKVALETGLDQLGHYVTVYYKDAWTNETKPGTAYCIVEEADYITVSEDITADKKDYLAAFGSKVEAVDYPVLLSFDNAGYYLEYNTADGADNSAYTSAKPAYVETAGTAKAGTYVVDSESGKIIAYIAPVSYSVSVVSRINTLKGKESIKLGTAPALANNEDEDVVVEYAGIAEDDVVIVKNYLGVTYLEKAEVVSGKITKTGTIDGKAVTYIDGKAYFNAGKSVAAVDGMVATSTPDSVKTYDAYVYGDKLIGVIQTAGSAALGNAIYVVDSYAVPVSDNYGSKNHYYAQGVDADGKEVTILIGIAGVNDTTDDGEGVGYTAETELSAGFYTFEKSKDREQAKKDIMYGISAVNESNFDDETYEFFADTATVAGNVFDKNTKKVTANSKDVYLTADTKYVVINNTGVDFSAAGASELEIATYTGSLSKNVAGETVIVAASVDADDNYLAETIVIVGSASLKAEDYIYVVDGSDYALVEGGREYNVYFSATNEFKTIIAKDVSTEAGFYGDYKVDEDGVYDLGAAETRETIVLSNKTVDGIMNTSIKFGEKLYEAKDVKIVDVRSEEDLKNTEVIIESLADLIAAKRNEYKITFNALVDTEDGEGEEFFTHLFISNIEIFNEDANGGEGAWEKA